MKIISQFAISKCFCTWKPMTPEAPPIQMLQMATPALMLKSKVDRIKSSIDFSSDVWQWRSRPGFMCFKLDLSWERPRSLYTRQSSAKPLFPIATVYVQFHGERRTFSRHLIAQREVCDLTTRPVMERAECQNSVHWQESSVIIYSCWSANFMKCKLHFLCGIYAGIHWKSSSLLKLSNLILHFKEFFCTLSEKKVQKLSMEWYPFKKHNFVPLGTNILAMVTPN